MKSLNDDKDYLVLNKVKKLLNSKMCFRLVFLRSAIPYNFDRLDSEGIVEVSHCYHEIYFVTDTDKKSWFIIIQNNNFFPDGNNIELAYFTKTDHFNSFWCFLFKKLQ